MAIKKETKDELEKIAARLKEISDEIFDSNKPDTETADSAIFIVAFAEGNGKTGKKAGWSMTENRNIVGNMNVAAQVLFGALQEIES